MNKYYGPLRDGGIKIKGVMAVRRDTPSIIRGAQIVAIRTLAKARNPTEWPQVLQEACRRLELYKKIIMEGKAPPRSLVIEKRVNPESQRRTPWRRVAEQAPLHLPTAKYIVTPQGRPHPVWLGLPRAYDIGYYLRLLQATTRELPPCPSH